MTQDTTSHPSSVSGNGLSWISTSTVSGGHLRLYSALGASPTSGVITLTYGSTQAMVAWTLTECTGVNATIGQSSAIGSSGTLSGSASSNTCTFAAFADPDDRLYGVFQTDAGSSAMTSGTNCTEVLQVSTASPATDLLSEMGTANDNAIEASFGGTQNYERICQKIISAP